MCINTYVFVAASYSHQKLEKTIKPACWTMKATNIDKIKSAFFVHFLDIR